MSALDGLRHRTSRPLGAIQRADDERADLPHLARRSPRRHLRRQAPLDSRAAPSSRVLRTVGRVMDDATATICGTCRAQLLERDHKEWCGLKVRQRGPRLNGDERPSGDGDGLFRTYSTAELLAMGGEITWLIKGVMVKPTHGMTAGEQKTLKTYVEMFMNIATSAGVAVFGRFDVPEACPVVSYVGEGGRVPHKSRLERVAEAIGVDLANIPLFTSYDVAPLDSDRFQKSL